MTSIALTQGLFAIIDDDDFERVRKYKWFAHKNAHPNAPFYANRNVRLNGRMTTLKLHRFILGVSNPKIFVDHINGNTLDCRKSNLRIATPRENSLNRKVSSADSICRVRGVSKHKKKFRARISIDGKQIVLGIFDTIEQASDAYEKAAKKHFGRFYRPLN